MQVILMENTQEAVAVSITFRPFYRNKKLQRSINYQDAKTWNSLESSLKKCNSLETSKSKLKHILSQKYTIQNKFFFIDYIK